jgi:hypothetical protein
MPFKVAISLTLSIDVVAFKVNSYYEFALCCS